MKKILFLLAFVLAGASAIAQGWVAPSNSEYLYSTVVFARLNTNLFPSSSNLVLGAFVNGDCKEMSADTFIFLLAKIMFVIVRCCTRPMDKRGISIIIVPDTD